MRACKVDEQQLGEWIDGSTGAIRYLGPAITGKLARKIIAADERTGKRSLVVIDLDAEMDRSGYGQTAGVRKLFDEGVNIRKRAGLRVSAFATPTIGVLWSPIAERIDEIKRVEVNGIWMEGAEINELRRWMDRMVREHGRRQEKVGTEGPSSIADTNRNDDPSSESVGQPIPSNEPEAQASTVDEAQIKKEETHLEEHPPRDFKQEKRTEVYQGLCRVRRNPGGRCGFISSDYSRDSEGAY